MLALQSLTMLWWLIKRAAERPIAIFLAGPPKAGKSLLSGGIYEALLEQKGLRWFVERLNPDMEGQWTWVLGPKGVEQAKKYKEVVKSSGHFFSPKFVALKEMGVKNLVKNFPITVFDLGGIPSPENARFIEAAKPAERILVVLESQRTDPVKVAQWMIFGHRMGLKVIPYRVTWMFGANPKIQAVHEAKRLLRMLKVIK